MDVVRVKEVRDSGMGASAIAKELGIGRASVYRASTFFIPLRTPTQNMVTERSLGVGSAD